MRDGGLSHQDSPCLGGPTFARVVSMPIASFSSGADIRDEVELGLLMEEVRRLLEDDRQGVLDLGITPRAR